MDRENTVRNSLGETWPDINRRIANPVGCRLPTVAVSFLFPHAEAVEPQYCREREAALGRALVPTLPRGNGVSRRHRWLSLKRCSQAKTGCRGLVQSYLCGSVLVQNYLLELTLWWGMQPASKGDRRRRRGQASRIREVSRFVLVWVPSSHSGRSMGGRCLFLLRVSYAVTCFERAGWLAGSPGYNG